MKAPVELDMEPLTGWPAEVIQDLEFIVLRMAKHKYVDKFFIGRTCHPQKRKFELESDGVIPIYKTQSEDCALDVEDYLVKVFRRHHKCVNATDPRREGISPGEMQYVFVAVWLIG